MRANTFIASRILGWTSNLLLLSLVAAPISAQVDVDRTCATCSRKKNDSLNLQVRKIRLNQVGYLPQDPNKAALVADPASLTFSVVEIPSRRAVHTGNLVSVGSHKGGAMSIRGAFNSTTDLYNLSRPGVTEALHRADFSAFKAPGTYVLACGKDTSAEFQIDPRIYNFVFETSLKFFGSNRCGKTDSWIHKDCHLKDGDALGAGRAGSLAGGWHDCGDHGKYSETVAYAAATLAMTYAFWPQKGEDFYGKSYNDTLPFGTDGVPDVLYEAKIGADYILKLYKASKTDGLIAKGDMYHSVGMGPGQDHSYWDVPENQDAQPAAKGGPARPVTAGIGSNVAGLYAASLAFFAWGWEPFDPAYARECLQAAIDIYDKLVMARRGTATKMPCCYPGGGPTVDDEGLAALGLWFATKDKRFGFDLVENPALGTSGTAVFNQGEFPGGIMSRVPFHHGGWTTDYENVHAFVLYGLAKLIVGSPEKAAAYGIAPATADSLKQDATVALKNSILIGSNGSTLVGGAIKADPPYNGVFTSADWGYNRYNMGLVTELFMYWDLTGSKDHYNIGIDNLNYNLGMNSWDISFVMGTGDRNLQHPHNRAANPEGYNAGGLPYKYRSPKGALMGGCRPGDTLIDDWEKYVNTETCIDFSAQFLIPAQMLAQDLPPDNQGPRFRNVNIFPEEKSAVVTWTTDEISRDSVILLDAPGGKVLQTLPGNGLLTNKQITITGLTPSTTYWIYFRGEDIRRNRSEDRNNGEYWSFTTKAAAVPAQISSVRVCNETHESALVTWWTRNGSYSSQVDYGKTTALGLSQSPDDAGIPTQFHRVTVKDLSPATLYYFQVLSGAVVDNNAGKLHTFKTTEVLVDYTIRIKPTNKANNGQGTHFYVDVTNHEQEPYTGLELRFYFTADAVTAGNLVAKGFDNQVFDVGGMTSVLDIEYGKPVQVPGMADQWYFPITLKSTLPVAGRARLELQVNTAANGGFGQQPFSLFADAWSVKAHAAPPDPVPFEGVDLSKGVNGIYIGPEMIEKVNGENVLTYVENPYITAYYKGVHVFGYGPDYKTDKLVVHRTASLSLTEPVASPVDRLDHRQLTGDITLAGKASSTPDGRIDQIILNGEALPESQLTRIGGEVSFSRPVTLVEGTNVFDIIAWDTANCAVEARKLIVNWRKGPPEPPPQAAKPIANPPGQAGRDSIVVGLTSATAGASIWYTLDGKDPAAGAAGSILYTGSLVIRNQTTLKAIAVKTGYTPSGIMEEKYDVFPFKVANVASGSLIDRDADGYADQVLMLLDTTLGAPSPTVVAGQMPGARITSGLVLGAFALSGDTLRIDLAANNLRIQDAKEKLNLPPPATLQDGMLRPGDMLLADDVAPVIRRAILRQGLPGQSDTLVTVFSESAAPATLGSRPFEVLRSQDSLVYDFVLSAGVPTVLSGLKEGEVAYTFIIQGTPSAADAAVSIAPQAGDWVWIDPAAGIADASGNVQANPANIRVSLQVHVALTHLVRGISSDGVSRLGPFPTGGPWFVQAGPRIQGMLGEGRASLPVFAGNPADSRMAGITIESSVPFAVTLRVHTTLGGFVTRTELKVPERDFALLEAGSTPGSRKLSLLWNGQAGNGNPSGTGAYVYMWNLTFFPAGEPARGSAGKTVLGLLRNL